MILHNTYRWLDKNRGRIRTAIGMAWPSVLESFWWRWRAWWTP